jgi:hypothetical protein
MKQMSLKEKYQYRYERAVRRANFYLKAKAANMSIQQYAHWLYQQRNPVLLDRVQTETND